MLTKVFNCIAYAVIFTLIMIQYDERGELLIAGHKGLLFAAVTCVVLFLINLALLGGNVFGGLDDMDDDFY